MHPKENAPLSPGIRPLKLRTDEIWSESSILRADGVRVGEGGRERGREGKKTEEEEGWRKKWPLSGRSPDDESNNNGSYSQHDHQDAHLLPGTPLGGEGGGRGGGREWLKVRTLK